MENNIREIASIKRELNENSKTEKYTDIKNAINELDR